MKLSDFKKDAKDYTGKASDVTRQFIIGGIAIIWLFATTDETTKQTSLDAWGIWPLITLTAAGLCDLLQYFIAGELWKSFFLTKEKEAAANSIGDPDVRAPMWYSKTINCFYQAKIYLMIGSYVLIIIFLLRNLNLETR